MSNNNTEYLEHDINDSRILAEAVMNRAQAIFLSFQHCSGNKKAEMLENIAAALEAQRPKLVALAHKESHLPEGRLNGELSRTTGQLKLFADLIREGSWVQASIDPALPDRKPMARTDIRKMLRPIGPVVVFGASNFPFAFSTLGGDTASALAGGCPVVVKAHPGHPQTSKAVFAAARQAITHLGQPADILQHIDQTDIQIGIDLVKANATAAVGFTGSFQAGNSLMQAAREREVPIEVYAEMSSTNPVVILDDLIQSQGIATAQKLAGSVALGVGQFCTNPGLIFLTNGPQLTAFKEAFAAALNATSPSAMLHTHIVENYNNNLQVVLSQAGVETLVEGKVQEAPLLVSPSLATVTADSFIHNSALKTEVFGPFSLLVVADDQAQLLAALRDLEGQLTASIFGTSMDLEHKELVTPILDALTAIAGRVIFNEVPTGVEVCHAMVHGGPFPSTSKSGFSSVGSTAILRWARPVCYQNFPDELLPAALQNANPLEIWRQLDGQWTKNKL